jgi:hypothetical protein
MVGLPFIRYEPHAHSVTLHVSCSEATRVRSSDMHRTLVPYLHVCPNRDEATETED